MKKLFCLSAVVILLCNSLLAQTIDGKNYDYLGRGYLNTITTAVPFLLVAPDSRAGAMGDMGVATSADANSQHHNPAKYVFNDNIFGISISYSPWLRKLTSKLVDIP